MVPAFLTTVLAPLVAADGDPPAATNTQPAVRVSAPASPDPVICRQLPRTGSRIAERVCLPQSEWERREYQERLNERQRGLVQNPPRLDY